MNHSVNKLVNEFASEGFIKMVILALTEIATVEGRGTWSVRLSLSVGKNEDELYTR